MKTSVFTCGDINGIGPEIVIKTINKKLPSYKRKIIFICPRNIFLNTINEVTPKFKYSIVSAIPDEWDNKNVLVVDIGNKKQNFGKPTITSGKTSYESIILACKLAKNKIVDSIITAPISKFAFIKAGINFPGHTELLANYFNVSKFTMMFLSKKMFAALATIHIPIKQVPINLTKDNLNVTIEVISNSLKDDFNIRNPKIALLGLNPHAGENGHIGLEEKTIINPLIKGYRNLVFGPFVPDAYFGNKLFRNFNCTIGLYHDQVLIPFKLLNFNSGVNFTAGLPIVRTSPDHGTAFDIAGKGLANPNSMIEALNYAEKISDFRRLQN